MFSPPRTMPIQAWRASLDRRIGRPPLQADDAQHQRHDAKGHAHKTTHQRQNAQVIRQQGRHVLVRNHAARRIPRVRPGIWVLRIRRLALGRKLRRLEGVGHGGIVASGQPARIILFPSSAWELTFGSSASLRWSGSGASRRFSSQAELGTENRKWRLERASRSGKLRGGHRFHLPCRTGSGHPS